MGSDLLIGWRAQHSRVLRATTGKSATEGEGHYLFHNKKEASDWFNARYLFEVKYTQPENPLHIECLMPDNSFLMFDYDESGELYKPIADTDSDWIKFHKHALSYGSGDMISTIKHLTILLLESGYDAIYVNSQPNWIVILNPELIISSNLYFNPEYKA